MIVDSAYNIQSNLLIGNSQYTPNYIFVEYKNVQSTSETVADEVKSTDTIEHYTKLNSDTDYLAIPITLQPRIVEPTGENKAAVEYSVVTSGYTAGELRKGTPQEVPFSTTDNSLIYSLGLVSRVKTVDGYEDILFARTVLDDDKQLLKTTSDIYITWKIEL